MRRLFVFVIALATARLLTGPGVAEEPLAREYKFAPGSLLELDLQDGGSVEIIGSDRENIEVTYGGDRSGTADGIRVVESGSGLSIRSSTGEGSHAHALRLTIRSPHRIRVAFKSMGGDLILAEVDGEFTGETMGGSIALKRVSGRADLKTFGGAIEAVDCALGGKLVTMGGEVLLRNVTGGVEAESFGGNVHYEGTTAPKTPAHETGSGPARSAGTSEDPVRLTSMGGDIVVDEAPFGADVRTGGGNIRVRKAYKFVSAETGGGDVEIEAAGGDIDASTGGGDIRVRTSRGGVNARTGGGDVEATVLGNLGSGGVTLLSGGGDMLLRIPPDASVTFDLEIAYTKNSAQNYTIESEFPIVRKLVEPWDTKEGSPKKRILGTGSVGGGEHVVRIKTVNGNIRIEKSS
jgi:DUF4097 and DUF4098 domain-containing protein YvlB